MHLCILFTLQCVSPFMHWVQRYIMIDSARQEKRIVLVLQLLFNQSKLTVKIYEIVCENSEIGNIFLFFPSPGHTSYFLILWYAPFSTFDSSEQISLSVIVFSSCSGRTRQFSKLLQHWIFINCKIMISLSLIPAFFCCFFFVFLIGSTTGLLRSLYEWCRGRGGAKASTSSSWKARMWCCDNWRFRWWPV